MRILALVALLLLPAALRADDDPATGLADDLTKLLDVFKILDEQAADPVSPDRNERLARCNDLTMQLNIVKLSLVQESLVVSAEHVVTPNADLDILVPLSVNHILQSVGFLFQSWLPIDDAPAGTPGDA